MFYLSIDTGGTTVIQYWSYHCLETINDISFHPRHPRILSLFFSVNACGKIYVIGRRHKTFGKDFMLVRVDHEVYSAERSVNGHCLWYSLIQVSDSSPFMQCTASFRTRTVCDQAVYNKRWPDKHSMLVNATRNNIQFLLHKNRKTLWKQSGLVDHVENNGILHGEYQ